MRGILINPQVKTVTEVEVSDEKPLLFGIYKALNCSTIDAASLRYDDDVVYFDDEGLLRSDALHFFAMWGNPSPFAGRGLILGTSSNPESEGETVSTQMELSEAKRLVKFPTGAEVVAMYNKARADIQQQAAEHEKRTGEFVIVGGCLALRLSDAGEVFSE